jgi:7-keto-8-aminopelargonate synthetase-like enzyme
VPVGTSRLRIAVSAEHTPEQLDALAAAMLSVLGGGR